MKRLIYRAMLFMALSGSFTYTSFSNIGLLRMAGVKIPANISLFILFWNIFLRGTVKRTIRNLVIFAVIFGAGYYLYTTGKFNDFQLPTIIDKLKHIRYNV